MDYQWSPQMRTRKFTSFVVILVLMLASSGIVTTLSAPKLSMPTKTCSAAVANPEQPLEPIAYPSDPTSDILWSAGYSGVSDIQTAFNHARTVENGQLGTSYPMMTLPSQATWNAMSDNDKALWLINRERMDRGVHALHGTETNVTSVAQNYATYLRVNNLWGHYADGHDPLWRLNNNPAIGACHDWLAVAENLWVSWGTGTIPLPIETAIYSWMYEDGACCSWGHRHAILWYPYTDNGGTVGIEGFLGMGRSSGPYLGQPNGEMIVMNVFDPCATWTYVVVTYPPRAYLPIIRK